MPASRHEWMLQYHTNNPFDRSLTQPITIIESADEDVEYHGSDSSDPESLKCSRYDFIFPYRDQSNQPRTGRARIWLPPHIDPTPEDSTVPTILSIHYTMELGGASEFLAEGWACVTPIEIGDDHGFNLVGAGMDHTLALAKLVRRLRFVDKQRIGWTGGSAGGYQCLMAAEALWPVAAAVADVPISDLHYNIQAIKVSNGYNAGITDYRALVIPIASFVYPVVAGTEPGYNSDPDEAWKHSVPPGAALIRSPMLITSSTADLLCPSAQIGPEFERVPKRGVMPPGWTNSYDQLHHPKSLGKTLIDWIPRTDVETICIAIPDTAPRVNVLPAPDGLEHPEATPYTVLRPFSRSRLVTALIQDEGAPDPMCGHTKYTVHMTTVPYFHFHFERGYVPVDYLTPLVLSRVIERFNPETNQNTTLPDIRRGYDEFDRYEAILSLRTFIGVPVRDENLETLRRMYSELPPVQRCLDVVQEGMTARFDEDPIVALLYHEAVLMREKGETAVAVACEKTLRTQHSGTTWAKLNTQNSV
jgi:hypothetical protein